MRYENRERMGGLCAEKKDVLTRTHLWLQSRAACTIRILMLSRASLARMPFWLRWTRRDQSPIVGRRLTKRAAPMMLRRLLDRYIFTELLSPFSLSLGTLCFIMLTRELLRLVELLVSKGVGLWAV